MTHQEQHWLNSSEHTPTEGEWIVVDREERGPFIGQHEKLNPFDANQGRCIDRRTGRSVWNYERWARIPQPVLPSLDTPVRPPDHKDKS